MSAFQIKTSSIEFISVAKLETIEVPNEHSKAYISGMVLEDHAKAIMTGKYLNSEISLTYVEDAMSPEIFFNGIINEISIKVYGQLYYAEVHITSYTCLLDKSYKFRTFQDKNQTLKSVVREIINNYNNAQYICQGESADLGSFFVQYQETDWEFIKRMAAMRKKELYAEARQPYIAFYVGLRADNNVKSNFSVPTFKMREFEKDGLKYREYELKTEQKFNFGSSVSFLNMELVVHTKKMVIENQERYFLYTLRTKEACVIKAYKNQKIQGAICPASVVSIKRDRLQIAVKEDWGKEIKKRWFRYATVYSSPDGSGWYCMPEEGDQVYLYFPDCEEEKAYVLNAMHLEESEKRNDPEKKIIRSKHKKEICFTPTEILLTNHKGTSIRLSDDKGIIIKTDKDIMVTSESGIVMSSKGGIKVSGQEGVVLKQKANMLAVRNGIREHGERISHQ